MSYIISGRNDLIRNRANVNKLRGNNCNRFVQIYMINQGERPEYPTSPSSFFRDR